jgi:hypothetical protein
MHPQQVVYIAAPLSAPTRAEIDANRERAARWAAWALVARGVSPSCSWIVLTGVLDETPENRARGLAADLLQVERADEVWLVGGRISSGMATEAAHAHRCRIPVVNLIALGDEPPPFGAVRSDTEPAPAPEPSAADWGVTDG